MPVASEYIGSRQNCLICQSVAGPQRVQQLNNTPTILSPSISFHLHSSIHVSSCLLEYYVFILPSDLLIPLTTSNRPLPDERPRQSVANLIGRFEQQQKRQPTSSGPPSRATSATSNNTSNARYHRLSPLRLRVRHRLSHRRPRPRL